MRCPIESEETSELLLEYCARRLDPAAAAVLERHMAGCPACRELFAGQRAVWEALDAWDAAPVARDFDRRLYRRIEREGSSSWWQRVLGPIAPVLAHRGLPIAAAAGLLIVAGALIETRVPAGAAPETRVEAVQAEQVERTLEDLELLSNFVREVRQAPAANAM